jgi:uncharacterized RDD family membrane protein YckC
MSQIDPGQFTDEDQFNPVYCVSCKKHTPRAALGPDGACQECRKPQPVGPASQSNASASPYPPGAPASSSYYQSGTPTAPQPGAPTPIPAPLPIGSQYSPDQIWAMTRKFTAAEPWERLKAAVVDNFITYTLPQLIPFAGLGLTLSSGHENGFLKFLSDLSTTGLIHFLYTVIMNALRGQTVGKMIFDITIVKTDGSPIDFKTAIIRYAIQFVTLGIADISILFDSESRGWHDKVAGTMVIRGGSF